MIGELIPMLGKGIFGWLKNRQELNQVKAQGRIDFQRAKQDGMIRREQTDAQNAGELDVIALQQNSWMDELIAIVVLIPVVMSFVPSMVQYVEAGFAALEKMPEWMTYLLAAIAIYYYGYKRILLLVIQAYLGNKFGINTVATPQKAKRRVNNPTSKDKPPHESAASPFGEEE